MQNLFMLLLHIELEILEWTDGIPCGFRFMSIPADRASVLCHFLTCCISGFWFIKYSSHEYPSDLPTDKPCTPKIH